MKITQTRLKTIIKEELENIRNGGQTTVTTVQTEGDEMSRTITQVERIGDEITRVAGMVADQAVLERLEMIDDMVTGLLQQMQGVEPAPRQLGFNRWEVRLPKVSCKLASQNLSRSTAWSILTTALVRLQELTMYPIGLSGLTPAEQS